MMRAVIIDDENSNLTNLETLLKKYCEDVKVVSSATDVLIGIDLINDYHPEIVFLNIQTPELNSSEVLSKIQFKDFHLITSDITCVLKKRTVEYLMHPVNKEDLVRAVGKVKKKILESQRAMHVTVMLKHLQEAQTTKIAVPNKNGIELVMPNDIVYIEARSNRSVVVLFNGNSIETTKALKDYEARLCGKILNFIRIHNSYIANMNFVTRYLKEDGGYAVIQDKKKIPISKHKKDEFLGLINFSRACSFPG